MHRTLLINTNSMFFIWCYKLLKMKKKIQVTMTYTVGLETDIPDEILNKIEEFQTFKGDSDKDDDIKDWLNANIKEEDGFEWEWTIDEIS